MSAEAKITQLQEQVARLQVEINHLQERCVGGVCGECIVVWGNV